MQAGLRIVARRRCPCSNTLAAAGERNSCRAGQPLQPRNAADVVEMLVAVQDDLHVLEPEAERADIVGDRGPRPARCRRRSGYRPASPTIRIEVMPQVPTR